MIHRYDVRLHIYGTHTHGRHLNLLILVRRYQFLLVISQDIQIGVYQLSHFDSQRDVDVRNQPTGIDDVLHAD